MAGSILGSIAASAAGSAVSGIFAKGANDDAIDAQTASADKALALQKEMFDLTRSDLKPYRDTGYAANKKLSALMGLDTNDRDKMRQEILDKYPALAGTKQTGGTVEGPEARSIGRMSLGGGNNIYATTRDAYQQQMLNAGMYDDAALETIGKVNSMPNAGTAAGMDALRSQYPNIYEQYLLAMRSPSDKARALKMGGA